MTTETKRPSAERWKTSIRDLDLVMPGGRVPLRLADRDRTQPYLLLHGGAGPASVIAFGDLLAARDFTRVLVPTHPGFDGTSRPDSVSTVRDLAALYVAALDRLDLYDVTVVGNSLGGWIAAEVAILGSSRVSGAVLIDAVGAEIPGAPTVDVRTLTPPELMRLSFADPNRLAPVPGAPGPSPELVRANLETLYTYGGATMSDPTLLDRLGDIELPVQVIWGTADRIVTPDHGRAFADAVPNAVFTLLEGAGHLPQIEAPEQLLGLLHDLGGDR
ncbi:MAG: hypothetical protein QOI06_2569 [Nocardioidaceae bacterium]|jgi:pimeloyl-ACP methyl ester carboxylesterase|nr:hypothetical protein [Nocardioidaceae bacterium]